MIINDIIIVLFWWGGGGGFAGQANEYVYLCCDNTREVYSTGHNAVGTLTWKGLVSVW